MIYEQRSLGSERVDTVRVSLETPSDLILQYSEDGYTEVLEHYLVLYKPPEKIILQEKLDSIAAELPDEIAIGYPDMYPTWMPGVDLSVGSRVQYCGRLYRVQQAHTAQSDKEPDISASLFSRINDSREIQTWTRGSYDNGVQVTHNGKTWISMVANNVWEPGAIGVYGNIWKEES